MADYDISLFGFLTNDREIIPAPFSAPSKGKTPGNTATVFTSSNSTLSAPHPMPPPSPPHHGQDFVQVTHAGIHRGSMLILEFMATFVTENLAFLSEDSLFDRRIMYPPGFPYTSWIVPPSLRF